MITLGLDVGLAHLGWAVFDGRTLLNLGCVETKPGDGSASGDLMRRANFISLSVGGVLRDFGVGRVVMEAVSWPRNSGAVGKMGAAYGAVAANVGPRPIEHVAPQTVRRALGLPKGKVDKDDMLGVVRDAPGCELLHELLEPLRAGLWEHPVDACAVVLASFSLAATGRAA